MRPLPTLVIAILWLATASTALADVQLSIRNGRVTLVARDATITEILGQWAKVGQTRIVNAEGLGGDRVTIELTDVSEEHALEVVLRQVGGYIAAPRRDGLLDGSRYDRIVLMPRSATRMAANLAAPSQASLPSERQAAEDAVAENERASPESAPADALEAAPAGPPAREQSAEEYRLAVEASRQSAARRGGVDANEMDRLVADAPAPAQPAPSTSNGPAPGTELPAHQAPPPRAMPSGQMAGRAVPRASVGSPRDKPFVEPAPAIPTGDIGSEDPIVTGSSVTIPTQDAATQESIKARRPIETVDPRQFHVPDQSRPPAGPVAPPAASRPGGTTGGASKPGGTSPGGGGGI